MKKILSLLALSLLLVAMPTVKTQAIEEPADWAYMMLTSDNNFGWGFKLTSTNGYEYSVSGYNGFAIYPIPHFLSADVDVITEWGYYKPQNNNNIVISNGQTELYATTNGQLNAMETNTKVYTLSKDQYFPSATKFNLKLQSQDNYPAATWDAVEGATRYYYQLMDLDNNLSVLTYGYETTNQWQHYSQLNESKSLLLVVIALNQNTPITYDTSTESFTPTIVGTTTFRIHVPTGVEYPSEDIYICARDSYDESHYFECMKMDKKEGNWYEKEITMNTTNAEVTISDQEITSFYNLPSIPYVYPVNINKAATQRCYEIYYNGSGYYSMYLAEDCNAPDHDYRAKDIKVTTSPGKATYSWTSTDKPYAFSAYINGQYFHTQKSEVTWYADNATTATAPAIEIYPLDQYNNYYGAPVSYAAGESIEPTIYKPQNFQVTDNKNNTFTITWNAVPDADSYLIAAKSPSTSYFNDCSNQRAHSFTTDILDEKGTWTLRVYAYDKDNVMMGTADVNLDLAELYTINECNVRVLIPNDSRFDTQNGVFAWWKSNNNIAGKAVQGTKEGSTNWYSFTITDIPDPAFDLMIIDNENKSLASHTTTNLADLRLNSLCAEIRYSTTSSHDLFITDCNQQEHNYTPTNLKADVSLEGRALLTWDAPEKLPEGYYYEIYLKFNDGKSPAEEWIYPEGKGNNTSAVFFSTQDRKVEYWLITVHKIPNTLAASDKGEGFSITGATNALTNLQATTTDNENFNFTWEDPNNHGSYRIGFYTSSSCQPGDLLFLDYTKSTSYSHHFRSYHYNIYWKVTALDSKEFTLDEALATKTISINPKNVYGLTEYNAQVDKMTVKFSWKSSVDPDQYNILINQEETFQLENVKSPYTYTFKTAGYTNWSVQFMEKNSKGELFCISSSYGGTFTLITPAEKYYTLIVKTSEGGSVNESVSGNYPEGATVTLEATPDQGKKFSEWSDHNEDNPRNYKVTKDVTLTAKFTDAKKYKITVDVTPKNSGIVKINGKEADSYEDFEGTEITLEAVANQGYLFSKWSEGETKEKITLTLDNNLDYTAEFIAEDNAVETVLVDNAQILIDGNNITVITNNTQSISLYDATGRIIQNTNSQEAHFQVTHTGLYILKINNNTTKLIIK